METDTYESTAIRADECPTLKPRWLRVPGATRYSGMGRSLIYEAIKDNKIKSVCVRKKNCVRGIRLINADSLDAFLESFVEERPQLTG
jgi:hypothetical protein